MADERIQTASQFLLQAPPGEINDVLNDVRNIIADDDALQTGLLPALREYNLAQFTVADVPGTEHQTIVSEAARVAGDEDEERFLDPRSKQTFRFDHLALEASDPRPHEPQADTETFRLDLENAAQVYLSGHYHSGVAAILSPSSSQNQYTIQLVANKYNPSNFWSGRWRSEYTVDADQKKLTGRVLVNVHYYEQGNVQLESSHSISLPLPTSITTDAASASKIFAIIESEESKFQSNLNDTYHDMGESTFKALRRALPLTRQKLDWDKVLGYKLGAELTAQNAVGVGQ